MRNVLENLRYPADDVPAGVKVQCFGNFEVFVGGRPLYGVTVPVLHTVYGKIMALQRVLRQILPCVSMRQKTFKSFVQFRHRFSF